MLDLKCRTREFAVRVVRLYGALPRTNEAQAIGRQLLRSSMSIGANYREACRARSDAEFVSKLEMALQEMEETRYWFELLRDCGITSWDRLAGLDTEANELTAILVTIVRKRKKTRISKDGG